MHNEVRTRFAPSPTGFLHIGGARTALFCWAYARHHQQGKFILRIEDTDTERSSQQSVDSIINAMDWLMLNYDEGPFYQTKRFERYKEVINNLVANKLAYPCYCSKQDLENMRNEQSSKGQKPKYDRRCLYHPPINPTTTPVIRFKNPDAGKVSWNDLVKGIIEIDNQELDDLIIQRSDGTPTYNFCVVVDDMDMRITHVIRGDDHVNNTPRQINILNALAVPIPLYAHVPMILNENGDKMSKRTDAVSVMQYKDMGILPEALLNYLARLCWGHENDEIFSLDQFVNWFNLDRISPSAARFDMKKLLWINAQHIKLSDNAKLAGLLKDIWQKNDASLLEIINTSSHINLETVIDLFKPRIDNLNDLAYSCAYFYRPLAPSIDDNNKHLTSDAVKLLDSFAKLINNITDWDIANIKSSIQEFCNKENIKMPVLGMPLRLKLFGTTQTPSFDALIHLLGKDETIKRILRP